MFRRLFGRKTKSPTPPVNSAANAPRGAATLPIVVREVTDADFDQVVLQSPELVIVDVWAEWCQPCETMSLYVAWLAQEYIGQLTVVALDADENPQVPEQYRIMGLPTLLFFRGGVEIDRQVGLLSYAELGAQVEAHLAA